MQKLPGTLGVGPVIQTWSTADVPRQQRFDYFVEALSSALIPMRADSATRGRTEARIDAAEFDGVTVIRQTGTAHWSYRDARELGRSGEHTFHLVANYAAPWLMSHRGRIRLQPGDAVLTDSMIGHRLVMAEAYDVVHVKLSESWLRRWVKRPSALVGRRIPVGAGWGRALTSFIGQLSPQGLVAAPLPSRVIIDQLGALLALISAEVCGAPARGGAASTLRVQVRDGIHQRCGEPMLTVDDLAAMLEVSVDEIHACLVPFGETFGALLVTARLEIAARMMESTLFRSLTADEIARRAGFSGEGHFEDVLRSRRGQTSSAMRAAHAGFRGDPPIVLD